MHTQVQWWVQHTFFRPGFVLARCLDSTGATTALVCNTHLILGPANPYRVRQVSRIHEHIERAKKRFCCERVVWCGDFNAGASEACIALVKELGFEVGSVGYDQRNYGGIGGG